MNLTNLAFRNRAVTLLLTGLLLAIGLAGLFSMSRREDPDLAGRFGQIIAVWPGSTAAQTESLVAEKIERTLREVNDIGTVTSTSRPGVAVVQFEAADRMTASLDKMMDDVRERMTDLRPSLPSGLRDIAVNDRFSDTSALIVAVTQANAAPRDLESQAKRVRDRLRLLPEVAEAKLIGEQQQVVHVSLSSPRLNAIGGAVTVDGIAAAIARRNSLANTGGSVTAGDTRLNLSPTGEFTNVSEIGGVVVGSTNGSEVYLRDVAEVTRGYADPPPFLLHVDGQPAIGVSLTMRKGRNISALGESAKSVLAEIRAELPAGARLQVVNDLPRSVERRVGEFFHELQLAVAIIFGVMLLFMGWRSALLVGVLLPLSMLGTFAAMWLTGRDIQQMSIAALIISLALVVDNSIVVLDNIEEKLSAGVDRETAAISGAEEIRRPLLTANLVAVTSFLPLAFLPGGVGDFIRDLGIVTSLSLVVSVLLNLTILPLLCFRFLRPTHEEDRWFVQRWINSGVASLRDGKASLAQKALARPGVVILLAAAALFGSVSLIPKLGFAFFPPAERDQFIVDVWLPEGRDIRATEQKTADVEAILARLDGVRSVVSNIGQGGPRFYYNVSPEAPAANYAQIVVNTRDIQVTERLVEAVQREAAATIAGARVTAKRLEQGPPVGAPIAIRLSGENLVSLRDAGLRLQTLLNATPGTHSVHDSFGEVPLQLTVRVDETRAALAGLSSAALARTARLAFSGETVSYLREGDTEIPIDLRLTAAERSGPGELPNLYLANGILLRDVATLALEPEPARIVRRNAERTLTVSAFADGSRLPSVIVEDVRAALPAARLPSDVRVAFGGESEEANESFGNMLVVFGAAMVVNIVLLVLQFGTPSVVAAVLSAVPLGVIGAVPGLYLARQNFGFMAFLGIAALGGIVTNHTIFLFHYALEERRRGIPMATALVDASRRRLRPILLTVLLSVGALLPQAFSGSKLWPPLDWAIIAGLLVSTFLSMIVVPSVYAALDRRGMRSSPTPEA